jgi:large subunit ribosomal protein L29
VAKVRELRDLGETELFERLESDKEELFNLRFQLATGQLDNPMRIKQVRHEIAQILTIVRERDLEAERELLVAAQSDASGGTDEEER